MEDHGGLHVCVTFLPPNERVEYQNVGRTARTGNRGTAQFIVIEKKLSDFEKMRMLRNLIEEQEINDAKIEISKTLVKDKVFKNFCDLLLYAGNEYERKSIEERFGILLQMNSTDTLVSEFGKFWNEIFDDLRNRRVIKNPCYYVLQGNKFLDSKQYQEAINLYTQAISLDSEFSENAYYNRAYARLMQNCDDVSNKKNEIRQVIDDFNDSRKRIKNRETELHIIQQSSAKEGNVLSEQVTRKTVMYSIQKKAIEVAIGMDEDDYSRTLKCYEEKDKESLEEIKKLKAKNPIDWVKIKAEEEKIKTNGENLKKFKDDDPMDGVIEKALRNGNDMKVEGFEIRKSFPEDQDIKLFDDEIEEFSTNGFRGKFEVSEIPPIDW